MHVLAADPLGDESERVPDREGDVGEGRELVRDLSRRVPGANDDHTHARVGQWVAVLGDVQKPTGKAGLAREDGPVGVREGPTGGDDSRGGELPSVVRHHHELAVPLTYRRHSGVGTDLDRERRGELLEVVGDLITGRVAIRVADERSPRHRAIGGR